MLVPKPAENGELFISYVVLFYKLNAFLIIPIPKANDDGCPAMDSEELALHGLFFCIPRVIQNHLNIFKTHTLCKECILHAQRLGSCPPRPESWGQVPQESCPKWPQKVGYMYSARFPKGIRSAL